MRAGWTVLSAAEVLQQYGYDPNMVLTSEGKLVLLDGGDAEQMSSDELGYFVRLGR